MSALIDTGASLNYMSPGMVRHLGLKKDMAQRRSVVLANGHHVQTNSAVTTDFMVETQETSGPEQVLFCKKCGA